MLFGTSAQRDLLRDLQRLAVDDVQCLLSLAAEIQPAAVGRPGRAVIDRHTLHFADDLIGRRVDQVDVVPLRVRLNNADLRGDWYRERR